MCFHQVSHQHNREIEKRVSSFHHSKLSSKKLKLPREGRYELSGAANCHAKDRSKPPCTAKYHSKDWAVTSNRCRENAANYHDLVRKYHVKQNFFEKPRKARNFDEIRLHYFCTILYGQNLFIYLHFFLCY